MRQICFNSRTCEGATPKRGGKLGQALVSIHAPVKVRLFQKSYNALKLNVSIHAPVKVRLKKQKIERQKTMFQFTHL